MNSSICRLLLAAALLAAEALHLQPLPGEDGISLGRPKDNRPVVEMVKKAGHLPDVAEFNETWSEMMSQHRDHVRVVPEIKLVMGVFTWSKEAPYSSIIRATWMRQPGVCKAPEGLRDGCGVYVTFVHGRRSPQSHLEDYNDTVILTADEAMDEGKTLGFFRFALLHYPWATHIGKMDTDVFPKWSPILDGLQHIPSGCESFVGRPWHCGQRSECPPQACGPPSVDGHFDTFNSANSSDSCWIYMQGGLYIASRGLLARATEPDGYWQRNRLGPEDVLAGHAMAAASSKYELCTRTWPRNFARLNCTHHHLARTTAPRFTKEWDAYYYSSSTKAQ